MSWTWIVRSVGTWEETNLHQPIKKKENIFKNMDIYGNKLNKEKHGAMAYPVETGTGTSILDASWLLPWVLFLYEAISYVDEFAGNHYTLVMDLIIVVCIATGTMRARHCKRLLHGDSREADMLWRDDGIWCRDIWSVTEWGKSE